MSISHNVICLRQEGLSFHLSYQEDNVLNKLTDASFPFPLFKELDNIYHPYITG